MMKLILKLPIDLIEFVLRSLQLDFDDSLLNKFDACLSAEVILTSTRVCASISLEVLKAMTKICLEPRSVHSLISLISRRSSILLFFVIDILLEQYMGT